MDLPQPQHTGIINARNLWLFHTYNKNVYCLCTYPEDLLYRPVSLKILASLPKCKNCGFRYRQVTIVLDREAYFSF